MTVFRPHLIRIAAALVAVGALSASAQAQDHDKLDDALKAKANRGGWSKAIVTWSGAEDATEVVKLGGRVGKRLELIKEVTPGIVRLGATLAGIGRATSLSNFQTASSENWRPWESWRASTKTARRST